MNLCQSWQYRLFRILKLYSLVAAAAIPVGVVYALITIFVWSHWILAIVAIGGGFFCGLLIWEKLEPISKRTAPQIEITLLGGSTEPRHYTTQEDRLASKTLYIERKYIGQGKARIRLAGDKDDNKITTSTGIETIPQGA